MRVVAGRARGRVLRAPAGTGTRPTSDRVREAVFNILSSMDVIAGAPVVDLFAGSGALGIEALSRGAASVTFVDHDRSATEAIRANLAVLGDSDGLDGGGLGDGDGLDRGGPGDGGGLSRIVHGDALGWVRRLPAGTRAGVVFADPPYAWPRWGELLASLAAVADLVVAETGGPLPESPAWETVTGRRYGGTVVTILRPLATPGIAAESGLPTAQHQRRGGN